MSEPVTAPSRIGLIVPSSNTTMETELPQLLRRREALFPAEHFTFHSSRVRMTKVTPDELRAMNAQMERAGHELSDARCDAVASACLVAIMAQGPEYHRAMEQQMCTWLGAGGSVPPVTTSAGALVEALGDLGARRIAVITPYTKELTGMVCDYIEVGGVEVADRLSLEVSDNHAVGRLSPHDLESHWKRLDLTGCDALVLSACVQMPSLPAIDAVEQAAGIPVLSAATATAYRLLQLLGREPVVPGAGWLLSAERER